MWKDFSVIEEARALQDLKDRQKTETEIGKHIGRTQEYVNQRTKLLKALQPEVKVLVGNGTISVSHAELNEN